MMPCKSKECILVGTTAISLSPCPNFRFVELFKFRESDLKNTTTYLSAFALSPTEYIPASGYTQRMVVTTRNLFHLPHTFYQCRLVSRLCVPYTTLPDNNK